MRNAWTLLALLVCFVGVGYGAHIPEGNTTERTSTTTGKPPEKKICTDDKDPDFRLEVGQQGPSPKGSCMLVKCEDVVDGKSVLTTIGCGIFMLTPGCNATGYDNTKLYPDCCPSEICDAQ